MTAATQADRPVEVTSTDPMYRQVNKGLMVAWINADLLNRCHHDVRRSIVFYDASGAFLWAFAADSGVTDSHDALEALWSAGARTWSRGIV